MIQIRLTTFPKAYDKLEQTKLKINLVVEPADSNDDPTEATLMFVMADSKDPIAGGLEFKDGLIRKIGN